MAIDLQQIFYWHDGNEYKKSCSYSIADSDRDTVIAKANKLLRKCSTDKTAWGKFETSNYWIWFKSSPGKKDFSGRPTRFVHILLCPKQINDSSIATKDLYSKLQSEYNESVNTVDEFVIADDELQKIPIMCLPEQRRINPLKSKMLYAFIGVLVLFAITAVVASYFIGKDHGKTQVIRTVTEQSRKENENSLKGIAENIGLKKNNIKEQDIVDRYKQQEQKILQQIAAGIGCKWKGLTVKDIIKYHKQEIEKTQRNVKRK